MRHLFASHVEKCTPNNEQQSISRGKHAGPVETITIDPPTETTAEPRVSNSLNEKISSPPSPNRLGTARNPQSTSPYHSGSNIIQSTRPIHVEGQPHNQIPRQGSASLPINITNHSTHHLMRQNPQNRLSQTLRPASLPQTLTVSPIQIPSPTPTRAISSSQQGIIRNSQPALNPIKIEVPPFRPPLPYVVDEDLTIEKEIDRKKKDASPMIYDVEESNTTYIHNLAKIRR